jgi:hypothetical protein
MVLPGPHATYLVEGGAAVGGAQDGNGAGVLALEDPGERFEVGGLVID